MEPLTVKTSRKEFLIEVKRLSFLGRFFGLMFSRREKTPALLFDFKKPVRLSIHSFFCFYPFLAVWLDEEDHIVHQERISSWRLSVRPEKPFVRLVEIPCSERYGELIADLEASTPSQQ